MSGYLTATIYGPQYVSSTIPTGGMALGFEMVLQGPTSLYGGMNILRYVQAYASSSNSTFPVGAALKMVGQDIVDMTAALGDIVVGVNDVVTAAVPKGDYFWMNKSGLCKPLVADSQAAGSVLQATSTAGTLTAWTAQDTAPANTNYITLAASGGSGGQTLTYKG